MNAWIFGLMYAIAVCLFVSMDCQIPIIVSIREGDPEIHAEVHTEIHDEIHDEIHEIHDEIHEIHTEIHTEIHAEVHAEIHTEIYYVSNSKSASLVPEANPAVTHELMSTASFSVPGKPSVLGTRTPPETFTIPDGGEFLKTEPIPIVLNKWSSAQEISGKSCVSSACASDDTLASSKISEEVKQSADLKNVSQTVCLQSSVSNVDASSSFFTLSTKEAPQEKESLAFGENFISSDVSLRPSISSTYTSHDTVTSINKEFLETSDLKNDISQTVDVQSSVSSIDAFSDEFVSSKEALREKDCFFSANKDEFLSPDIIMQPSASSKYVSHDISSKTEFQEVEPSASGSTTGAPRTINGMDIWSDVHIHSQKAPQKKEQSTRTLTKEKRSVSQNISVQPSASSTNVSDDKVSISNEHSTLDLKNGVSRKLIKNEYFMNNIYEKLESDKSLYVSKPCMVEIKQLRRLIEKNDEEAVNFLNFTGKLNGADLDDGHSFLGSYSECLDTKISAEIPFTGTYCMAKLNVKKQRNLAKESLGISSFNTKQVISMCIPISCTSDDIIVAANGSLKELTQNIITSTSCHRINDDKSVLPIVIICTVALLFIILRIVFHWQMRQQSGNETLGFELLPASDPDRKIPSSIQGGSLNRDQSASNSDGESSGSVQTESLIQETLASDSDREPKESIKDDSATQEFSPIDSCNESLESIKDDSAAQELSPIDSCKESLESIKDDSEDQGLSASDSYKGPFQSIQDDSTVQEVSPIDSCKESLESIKDDQEVSASDSSKELIEPIQDNFAVQELSAGSTGESGDSIQGDSVTQKLLASDSCKESPATNINDSENERQVIKKDQPRAPIKGDNENDQDKTISPSNLKKLVTNFIEIFRTITRKRTHKKPIKCLDGLRVFGTVAIIVSHMFSMAAVTLLKKSKSNEAWTTFVNICMSCAALVVDASYFTSGLLNFYTAYRYVRQIEMGCKATSIFIAKFLSRIYFRLTVVMMVLIMVSAACLHHISLDPNYVESTSMYSSWCYKNWWKPLIHIQNWVHTDKMCFGPSWYISTDMQFAISVPTFALIYRRSEIAGISSFLAIILLGVGLTIYETLESLNSAGSHINAFHDGMNEYDTHIYMMPYSHFAPYCIGMLMGYFMVKHQKLELRKIYQICVLGASLLFIAIILSTMVAISAIDAPASFYVVFRSIVVPIFILALGGWILGCHYNFFCPGLTEFLSGKYFELLSRLTYTAYLVHPVIMTVFYSYLGTDDFPKVYWVLGLVLFFPVTYVLAAILVYVVEEPWRNIIDFILRWEDTKPKSTKEN